MTNKTKILITYTVFIHVVVMIPIYNRYKPEPPKREYNPSPCLHEEREKCANTFEKFIETERAKDLLTYEYLREQADESYRATERAYDKVEKARIKAYPNSSDKGDEIYTGVIVGS